MAAPPPEKQPPLSLRSTCLRLLASALALPPCHEGARSGTAPGEVAWAWAALPLLPQELRLDLFLLLARWRLLGDADCEALGCACFLPAATTLSLAGCCLLSGHTLASHLFAGPLLRLESLILRGVPSLTDTLLEQVLDCCSGLRQLDVSRCPQLGAAGVAALGAWQAGVRAGGGEGQPAATEALPAVGAGGGGAIAGGRWAAGEDSGPSGAASSGGGLEFLSLAGCWQVGDISALAACTCLTALSLDGCWQLRGYAVRQVLECLPRLESLSLSGCFQIDSSLLVSRTIAVPAAAAPAAAEEAHPQDLEAPFLPEATARFAPSPGLPLAGVQLPRLGSLELGGTAVQNDVLLWVAMRCCARLQKLGVAGCKRIDGMGIAAVLSAKSVLLLQQPPTSTASATSLVAASSGQQQAKRQAPAPGQEPVHPQQGACPCPQPLEVLPLLELDAGFLLRWTPTMRLGAGLEELEPDVWWQQQQAAYESSQGPLCLHPSPGHPPIPWQLPPSKGRSVPAQLGLGSWHPSREGWPASWPPETVADVLLCLGSRGLGLLEGLNLSQGEGRAGAVGTAAAAVVGQHCSALRRLSLSGCQVPDAEVADIARLPHLTKLDVSGCTGSKTATPGSQFQRRPAKRHQLGGVSDESLAILAQRTAASSWPQMQIGSPMPASVAGTPSEAAPSKALQPAAGRGSSLPHGSGSTAEPMQFLNAGGLLVTDASIGALAGLSSLQLRGCKRVSDTGVLHCLLASPQLVRLDLGGCSQLSAAALGCSFANGSGRSRQQAEQDQKGTGEGQPALGQAAACQQHAQHGQRAASQQQAAPAVVSSLSHAIPRQVALSKGAAGAEVLAWLSGHAWPPGRANSWEGRFADGGGRGSSGAGGWCSSGGVSGGEESEVGQEAEHQGLALGPWWGCDRGLAQPLGCSPLQKLELNCCTWQAPALGLDRRVSSRSASSNTMLPQQTAAKQASPVDALVALAAACPQLRSLQLLHASGLGPGFVPVLAESCQLLSRLSITDCGQLSNADVAALAVLPALLQLNLTGCTQVGDAGLMQFAAAFSGPVSAGSSSMEGGMPEERHRGKEVELVRGGGSPRRPCLLLTLRLDGCGAVSNAGVGAVLQVAPHLETLSLRRLQGVTDATAGAALAGCANLRTLCLVGSGVRGDFVGAFCQRLSAGSTSGGEIRGSGAVVCLGLGLLELPQAVRARLLGAAGLHELQTACPQLMLKFG